MKAVINGEQLLLKIKIYYNTIIITSTKNNGELLVIQHQKSPRFSWKRFLISADLTLLTD